MGFPVAYHKATLAQELTWIGAKLGTMSTGMFAEVPEPKVQELVMLLEEAKQSNVISKRSLRSLIGKAMSMASVLYVWRPFIQQLHTALHSEQSRAPQGCVWTKQIQTALDWLLVFLQGESAGIRQEYSLRKYLGKGDRVVITWDASPYGMGAILEIAGIAVEFFAIGISNEDVNILVVKRGDCKSQQTLEALAGLIALRVWFRHLATDRVLLKLRGDNMGALVCFNSEGNLFSCRPHSPRVCAGSGQGNFQARHRQPPPRIGEQSLRHPLSKVRHEQNVLFAFGSSKGQTYLPGTFHGGER